MPLTCSTVWRMSEMCTDGWGFVIFRILVRCNGRAHWLGYSHWSTCFMSRWSLDASHPGFHCHGGVHTVIWIEQSFFIYRPMDGFDESCGGQFHWTSSLCLLCNRPRLRLKCLSVSIRGRGVLICICTYWPSECVSLWTWQERYVVAVYEFADRGRAPGCNEKFM